MRGHHTGGEAMIITKERKIFFEERQRMAKRMQKRGLSYRQIGDFLGISRRQSIKVVLDQDLNVGARGK